MIKIEYTETHNIVVFETSAGKRTKQVLVAPAKLVLVECNRGDAWFFKDKHGKLQHHDGYGHEKRQYFKPIFISETEKIEVGDLSACYDCTTNEFVGIGTVEEIYENNIAWCSDHKERLNYQFICRKILALSEHFSPQQLQMIVDGKLKDGDKVLIECEKSAYCEGCNKVGMRHCAHADTCGYPIEFTKIKLNPHITIYPVEEKMYTKEEVIQLLDKCFGYCIQHSTGIDRNLDINKWFEQNVK